MGRLPENTTQTTNAAPWDASPEEKEKKKKYTHTRNHRFGTGSFAIRGKLIPRVEKNNGNLGPNYDTPEKSWWLYAAPRFSMVCTEPQMFFLVPQSGFHLGKAADEAVGKGPGSRTPESPGLAVELPPKPSPNGCGNQKTGISTWVARSVSGNMDQNSCGLPLLFNLTHSQIDPQHVQYTWGAVDPPAKSLRITCCV